MRDKVVRYAPLDRDDLLGWHRILADQGWIAPAWPREWGGTGWNVVQRYIFEEECGYAGAPPLIPFGLAMCAPVLLKFGTDAQKQRFLPRIYRGDDFWCQGYSEPGSGSDLASLRTSAVRRGDRYVVNGQKTWTTIAHMADWIFCLVRTDAAIERKQDGISFLLIDMKTPGITVRPLPLMDGGHEVNEVFFDDVEVPVENRVHDEGKGWTVAKYLLGHERMNTARIGTSKRELERLKAFAAAQRKNGRPLTDDPRFRDKLSRLEIELMALAITNLRFLDQLRGGRAPGAEVSMLKIKGTEIQQALTELMLEAGGPLAQVLGPVDGDRCAGRRLPRRAGAALLQHAQDDDLRRLERDPAQHHRQARARALTRDELRSQRRAAAARRVDRALRRARLRVRDAPQDRRVARRLQPRRLADDGGAGPARPAAAGRVRRLRRRRDGCGEPDGGDRRRADRRAVARDRRARRATGRARRQARRATSSGGASCPPSPKGTLTLAFAHAEAAARYTLAHVATRARADDGGYVISGVKRAVVHGACADLAGRVGAHRGGDGDADGISLFLVERDAPGVDAHRAAHARRHARGRHRVRRRSRSGARR